MDTSKHPSSHLVDGLDTARSGDLFAAACELIPGGVNSTARATWAGWNPYPLFVESGQGSHLNELARDVEEFRAAMGIECGDELGARGGQRSGRDVDVHGKRLHVSDRPRLCAASGIGRTIAQR